MTWASDAQIVLGAKKLRKMIEMGAMQYTAPTTDENDQALHFLQHYLCAILKNEQEGYKEYDEMIDIMQVAESHDEVLRKNFVAQPPERSVGLEVKRKAKAPTEAHLIAVDSAIGADAMAPSSTSTPLDILVVATIIAYEENVTQEQMFPKADTFLDFV
ncbi:hypothetical protein E2562_012553 [Oryza meyeriana var. granulata]|uniref:Uncharacterized protein n=1 Tax=Oryza meyeriana var. granulata TaxID=110450 RepID=A0A6G1D2U9_9ORYZ|nr:hypothetical protein E2562_012553 [Oryza meyeriana var. granulata]